MLASRQLNSDQRRILSLAANGLTSAQAAARLRWTVDRVHQTLDEAMDALEATSKLDAIVIAYRHGYL